MKGVSTVCGSSSKDRDGRDRALGMDGRDGGHKSGASDGCVSAVSRECHKAAALGLGQTFAQVF